MDASAFAIRPRVVVRTSRGLITDGVEAIPTDHGDRTFLSRLWAVLFATHGEAGRSMVVSGGFRGNELCFKLFQTGRDGVERFAMLFFAGEESVFVSKRPFSTGGEAVFVSNK